MNSKQYSQLNDELKIMDTYIFSTPEKQTELGLDNKQLQQLQASITYNGYTLCVNGNGASATIPTPTHKVNRWDTWTSVKVVIGESNGSGDNKTEFNLKSLNVGLWNRA